MCSVSSQVNAIAFPLKLPKQVAFSGVDKQFVNNMEDSKASAEFEMDIVSETR